MAEKRAKRPQGGPRVVTFGFFVRGMNLCLSLSVCSLAFNSQRAWPGPGALGRQKDSIWAGSHLATAVGLGWKG